MRGRARAGQVCAPTPGSGPRWDLRALLPQKVCSGISFAERAGFLCGCRARWNLERRRSLFRPGAGVGGLCGSFLRSPTSARGGVGPIPENGVHNGIPVVCSGRVWGICVPGGHPLVV